MYSQGTCASHKALLGWLFPCVNNYLSTMPWYQPPTLTPENLAHSYRQSPLDQFLAPINLMFDIIWLLDLTLLDTYSPSTSIVGNASSILWKRPLNFVAQ